MAQIFLQPPEFFDFKQSQLGHQWKTWKQRFLIYLDVSDNDSTSDRKKVSLLLHAMGREGIELYNTFTFPAREPSDDGTVSDVQPTLEEVLEKFDDHFIPTINVTFERHRFFVRDQVSGETTDGYLTGLRTLAKTCEFGELRESLIRDRFVCGIANKAVKERLLRTKNLTLAMAIDICKASESAKEQLRVMETATAGKEEMARDSCEPQLMQADAVAMGPSRSVKGRFPSEKCSRCGWAHGTRRCPAIGKPCHKCKRTGHFASMCKSKAIVQMVRPDRIEWEYDGIPDQKEDPVGDEGPTSDETTVRSARYGESLYVGLLDGKGEDSWQVSLRTNGLWITYKLDTGAQVNILPNSLYQRLMPKPELDQASSRLFAYGATAPLNVDGQCLCDVVSEDSVSRRLTFHVLSDTVRAEPLLGLEACDKLNLVKRVSTACADNDVLNRICKDYIARDYSDMFDGIGCLKNYPYTIRLREDAEPFAFATARRVPYNLYDKVKEELERMKKMGVISEVTEPTSWVSPMVVVPKKNGAVRICVDYTKLNKSVQRERYQLPRADEIFARLRGAKYFTTLDAAAGFWQIPLTESCSELTTFITPFGRFRFKRLPFGLSSGPEVFHRVMKQVLEGIDGVDCFIDDVLVWGETVEQHDQRLRQVFERFRKCQVQLQPSKCVFRANGVRYYGHVLSGEGVKLNEDKLEAIVGMKKPENREEVRRFLGLVAYVAKFLPGFSQVAAPLRELMREDMAWLWTSVQDTAFSKLKEMIMEAPVLAYYSQDASKIVSADASAYGIGAVLLQLQDDGRKAPVSYISRVLSSAEKRYSQIEKEALAMTWALEKFHCYIFGSENPIVVETDHKPLQTIMNVQSLDECPPRLMRMKLRMMKYCFHGEYVPRKSLVVADALSRAPVGGDDSGIVDIVDEYISVVTDLWPASDHQLQRIRDETRKDSQLTALLRILQTNWPLTKSALTIEVKPFWDGRHLFSQIDGLILRGNQLVIPRSLRAEMMKRAHEGHFGMVKTKSRAREVIWWPGMNNQLEQMIINCDICARYQSQQRKEPLQSTELPERPWERVAVDLCELQGNVYLVLVDYYSRFPEIRRLSNTRSMGVVSAMKEIFACHGIPNNVVSDNGPQFVSQEFAQFASTYGFSHTTSSPRYPQGNGLVERTVQTVKALLKKALLAKEDYHLALLVYRSTPHETTSISPAQLLMGRRLRTTLPSSSTYLQPELVKRPTVYAEDKRGKENQAAYYNKRYGVRKLKELRVGDNVNVWDMEHRQWRIPAVVIKIINPRSFVVKLEGGVVLRRNRHQLQWRPPSLKQPLNNADEEFDDADEEFDDADEEFENDNWEQDRKQKAGGNQKGELIGGDNQNEMEEVGASEQKEKVVTRSGRCVKLPAWRRDYFT